METYRTDGHLDWLSVTLPEDIKLEKIAPTLNSRSDYDYKGKGLHGYSEAWVTDIGVLVMRKGRPDMGTHVVFPGQTLEHYRSIGITDKAVCQYVGRRGARASRIDLAIDVFDGMLTPGSFMSAFEVGNIKCRARDAQWIKDVRNKGRTLYIGKRSSKQMMRVYHKGAEQGTDENWIRLELEMKNIRARAILNDLQDSTLETRHVVNAAIGNYMQWSNNYWRKIITDENMDILTPVEKKLRSTYRWLMDQVAPALARYQIEHDDEDVIGAFLVSVKIEMENYKRTIE